MEPAEALGIASEGSVATDVHLYSLECASGQRGVLLADLVSDTHAMHPAVLSRHIVYNAIVRAVIEDD